MRLLGNIAKNWHWIWTFASENDKDLSDLQQVNFIKHSEVQYIAEKPVESFSVIEVAYELRSKSINPANIKSLKNAKVINR